MSSALVEPAYLAQLDSAIAAAGGPQPVISSTLLRATRRLDADGLAANGADTGQAADSELRRPPHSPEAERAILGGLLLDSAGVRRDVDLLATEHFFAHQHRVIYRAILGLMTGGKPVDIIAVHDRLRNAGESDAAGGMVYLDALHRDGPAQGTIAQHVEVVIDAAQRRAIIATCEDVGAAAFLPGDRTALALSDTARRRFDAIAVESGPRPALFNLVDLEQLGDVEQPAQEWFWAGYIPAGYLTMLSGHGGSLKTTFSLGLACCMAAGAPFLGVPTRPARVLFFSGEDPASLVLRRVDRICRSLELDPRRVRERLVIVDATEFDPVLFVERRSAERSGTTTATYGALAELVEERRIEVLIVDNASDVFEGDEIRRSLVGAFMRALVALVRSRGGAVLLLAHVDKGTSRAGKSLQNTESYSGSTAWHNKARSRLFLVKKDDGRFELQHQKNNLGPLLDTIELEQVDGLLQLPARQGEPGGATAQAAVDASDTRALLRLIAEFSGRGEFVSTATNSPFNSAVKLFGAEKTFPKRKPAEVFGLLREAERDGYIERAEHRIDRKPRERWEVTPAGRAFANLPAHSAHSAPSD